MRRRKPAHLSDDFLQTEMDQKVQGEGSRIRADRRGEVNSMGEERRAEQCRE